MAGIQDYLNQIKNAIYGREVRQAIHDGIEQCYKDGKAGAVDLVARQEIAELIAPSGEAPSAAEVTDARVGADGVTYTSLGLANRTQFTNLKNDSAISESDYETFLVNANLIHGSNYGSSLGTQQYRVTFKDFISFSEDILLFISNGFKAYVPIQKTDGSYDAGSTQRKQLFIPKGTKFSVIIMRENEDTSEVADFVEFAMNCKFKRMGIPTRMNFIDGFYKANNVYNKKSVAYSSGEMVSAGSYFNVYEFLNPQFKHVKVQASLSDRTPAVIAFYNGNTYLQSESVCSTAYGDIQWAEADVPSDCDKMLITSRLLLNDNSPFIPQILISEESDRLSNYITKQVGTHIDYGYIDVDGNRFDQNYVRRATTDLYEFVNPKVSISINAEEGFQFSVSEYVNGALRASSSWRTSFESQLYCDKFAITIKRVVDDSEMDLTLTSFDDIELEVTVSGYKTVPDLSDVFEASREVDENIFKRENAHVLGDVLFNGYKYCSHIFIDTIAEDEPVIPCQSIFDIEIASRLGYRMVELNVHKTATAGKYIVMHGESGKIGHQLKALDGSYIENLDISSVSYDDFKTKYVYRSRYAKYQVPVTDMEEALYACKKYNIIPFVMYAYDVDQIDVIKSIVGNNFVLYIGSTYYLTRYFFDGAMQLYTSIADVDTVKSICKNMGAPFMYSLSPETVSSLSDNQIKNIVKAVHDEGCLIGFAGAYQNPVINNKLIEMGFDYSGTGWDVEEFTDGNLANLRADLSFADFHHDGVESQGVLSLTNGDSISSEISDTPFLSKAILRIQFEGTLRISMGNYIHHNFESDGRSEVVLSTYFLESAPNFTASAVGSVDIINCSYSASKC